MPRKPRITADGLYQHVVHRGISQQNIFFDDADRLYFLQQIARASERHELEILAYCLMDNHYHLLLRDCRAQISRAMALINGRYTSYVNLRYGRDGALLRGRFFSKPSDEPRYAICALRYIHLNPVAAGIAPTPEKYHWSSHRHYMHTKADDFVATEHMLNLLAAIGIDPNHLDQWVQNPISDYLYDESIAQKQVSLSSRQQRSEPRIREPPARRIAVTLNIAQQPDRLERHQRIISAVAHYFRLTSDDIQRTAARYKDPRTAARYVAVFACYISNNSTYEELSKLFTISQNSVGIFIKRGEIIASSHRLYSLF